MTAMELCIHSIFIECLLGAHPGLCVGKGWRVGSMAMDKTGQNPTRPLLPQLP